MENSKSFRLVRRATERAREEKGKKGKEGHQSPCLEGESPNKMDAIKESWRTFNYLYWPLFVTRAFIISLFDKFLWQALVFGISVILSIAIGILIGSASAGFSGRKKSYIYGFFGFFWFLGPLIPLAGYFVVRDYKKRAERRVEI